MAQARNVHNGGQQMPLFVPPFAWSPPAGLPDLRRCGIVALDTEERDEGLAANRGSAWFRRGGHVAGVSVAWREGAELCSLYAPLRHPDTDNLDVDAVSRWLRDLVAEPSLRFVTQNGPFDWGWLGADLGVPTPPGERLEEVGAAATLVDENRLTYNLDDLCAWRGVPGKDESLLREASVAYGFGATRDTVKGNLWRLPARYVGPYAEADSASTLLLWEDLLTVIEREGTHAAYRLECDILPLVNEMRRRGVRLDVDRIEQNKAALLAKRDAVFADLGARLGQRVGMEEIGRNRWLEATFARVAPEIPVPRTAATKGHPKGQASFTAGSTGWMHKYRGPNEWLPHLIVRADKYHNAAEKFLQGYLLDYSHRGRVHAEIHSFRDEEGDGTRSLRFSYSDPPLQQMTARDEELAPMIRGSFLPEEGGMWAKPDVSQQEYRFIVHYAARLGLPVADEAARRYVEDPSTDFHMLVVDMTGLERKPAKDTNFAKAFGAGVPRFASMINKSVEEAQEIYDQYDAKLPFVQQLFERCEQLAASRGFIRLYDGARRHWDDWEPRWLSQEERARGYAARLRMNPCRRGEADERTRTPGHPWYGKRLRRYEARKAMNALIQGSAARHTKLWMRACWREGIVPLLQLHDELDCSVWSAAEGEAVRRLGEEAVQLVVPVKVDLKYGRSWGTAKHKRWEDVK